MALKALEGACSIIAPIVLLKVYWAIFKKWCKDGVEIIFRVVAVLGESGRGGWRYGNWLVGVAGAGASRKQPDNPPAMTR